MKKILIALFSALVITSCNDEDHSVDINNYNGQNNVAYFTNGNSGTYFVTPDAENFKIQVGATNKSNTDRTYNVTIDESSTAASGVDFSLMSNTVTIPSGEFFGEIEVQGIFEGTTAEGSSLVLNLSSNGDNLAMVDASYEVTIVQKCVSDLAGTYSVTTTYGYHDFLPSYSSNTMEVEIVEISEGLYEVFDFSGGLYSSGPYSTSYGTTSFTVQFSENCGAISWEGQSDAWGPCVPLDGGVNSVNYDNGQVTISWYCEAYGENGVSVYTPL